MALRREDGPPPDEVFTVDGWLSLEAVLSLPWELRRLAAMKPGVIGAMDRIFAEEIALAGGCWVAAGGGAVISLATVGGAVALFFFSGTGTPVAAGP